MGNDMKTLVVIAKNGTYSFPVADQTARDAANTAQRAAQSANDAVGSLGNLATKEKSNLVAAINEVHSMAEIGDEWDLTIHVDTFDIDQTNSLAGLPASDISYDTDELAATNAKLLAHQPVKVRMIADYNCYSASVFSIFYPVAIEPYSTGASAVFVIPDRYNDQSIYILEITMALPQYKATSTYKFAGGQRIENR